MTYKLFELLFTFINNPLLIKPVSLSHIKLILYLLIANKEYEASKTDNHDQYDK